MGRFSLVQFEQLDSLPVIKMCFSFYFKKGWIIWTKHIWILSYLKKKLQSLLKPMFQVIKYSMSKEIGYVHYTLRSFLMGIRSTFETNLTLDDIISTFRKKYSENAHICQPFSSDDELCNVFERFLENPLGKYNENTTDLFLHALCNSYNENIILIKSDRNSSWIEDITPNAGGENKTLNFVKTLSEHIDPILSCAPQTMGGNNA